MRPRLVVYIYAIKTNRLISRTGPCWGGLEYLHRSPCESWRNAVSDETVIYGCWSSVTRPVCDCTVSYRPVLSSERAPYRKNNNWCSVTWPVGDCTASYRRVFSSERAPYRKNDNWSWVTWPVSDCTVSYWTVLSSERKNHKEIVTKERIRIKSGHGSLKGARYQDELVDWLSAVR
jgi:hypothetical protein